MVEFMFCVKMSFWIGFVDSGLVVDRNIGELSGMQVGFMVIECLFVSGMFNLLIGLFVLLGVLVKNMQCGLILSIFLMWFGLVCVQVLMFCMVVCIGVILFVLSSQCVNDWNGWLLVLFMFRCMMLFFFNWIWFELWICRNVVLIGLFIQIIFCFWSVGLWINCVWVGSVLLCYVVGMWYSGV